MCLLRGESVGPELQVCEDGCALIAQNDVDLHILGTGDGSLEGGGVGLAADLGGGVDQLEVAGAIIGVDQDLVGGVLVDGGVGDQIAGQQGVLAVQSILGIDGLGAAAPFMVALDGEVDTAGVVVAEGILGSALVPVPAAVDGAQVGQCGGLGGLQGGQLVLQDLAVGSRDWADLICSMASSYLRAAARLSTEAMI